MAPAPAAAAKNYIYWRGGQLTFGKLTMADTDWKLVDDDPGDPLESPGFIAGMNSWWRATTR